MTLQVQVGAQFEFGSSPSFTDPGDDYDLAGTAVTLSLSAVGNDAGRQSDKADLGANRHMEYECIIAVDYTGEVPVSGQGVDVFWAPSASTTAANANVAANSGVDAVAPGGAVGSITLDEFILMCDHIGRFEISDDAAVQTGYVGRFSPTSRYGQIIVVNRGGAAFEASNSNMAVWLTPIQLADA